jgi:O-antigen ligase
MESLERTQEEPVPAAPLPRPRALAALAPAAALALVGGWAGTFDGAAGAAGAATVHAVLLACALAAAPAWRDPLALGRRGRLLPAALWALAAASCWASPVPRAGWVAVATLPAWLLLPAAAARAWGGARRRRLGLLAVAAAVLAVSLAALGGRLLLGDPRAAAPLGHHNLLAVWLLAVLPLAALPWRRGGAPRLLSGAAVAAALAALLASRSLSGAAGLAAMAALAVLAALTHRDGLHRRRAALLAAAGAVALVLLAPRLSALLGGRDPSLAARLTYWRAGISALPERPLIGHGPGSVAWTLGDWLRPVPGVNPPHEVVGDLHSLPLGVLYELGATGLLLAAALLVLFAWRRLVARPGADDPALLAAGLLGLAGASVACLAVAPLAVPAVPLAMALAAGAALAGEGGAAVGGEERGEATVSALARGRLPAAGVLPVVVYVLAAAPALARLDLAHRCYDRSIGAIGSPAVAEAELAAAVDLDPAFPLYRAHLARLQAADGAAAAAAREALSAAEQADGVAALWMSAGALALAADEPWSGIALERACRLDPLGAPAPFLLAAADPGGAAAAVAAGRALLAEPRLAAAVLLAERPALRAAAVEEAAAWPGVDLGWAEALVLRTAELPAADRGGVAVLRLVTDRRRDASLALWAFRRRPRPLEMAAIPLYAGWARHLDLPAATTLATTPSEALGARGCRPSGR